MTRISILIIDDDFTLAEMYAEKLRLEGFDVDIAHDGLAGFEKMRSTQPNLVLLDIMMPEMNGQEMLRQAKQDVSTKAIPVIMLTNLAGTADLQTALKEGALGYIVKSEFTPSEVIGKIKALLAPLASMQSRTTA
jgi:two-component system response regulator MtrA